MQETTAAAAKCAAAPFKNFCFPNIFDAAAMFEGGGELARAAEPTTIKGVKLFSRVFCAKCCNSNGFAQTLEIFFKCSIVRMANNKQNKLSR